MNYVNLPQPQNLSIKKSLRGYNSANSNVLGIISNMQLGKTDLFLFSNGFLVPTYQSVSICFNEMSFNLLDRLQARDMIFETNAFIPNEYCLKNMQMLANCVQLDGHTFEMPSHGPYSGEIYDRLNSALHIVNSHSFFILIEPFRNLEKEGLFNTITLIGEMRRQGKIILLLNRHHTFTNFSEIDNGNELGTIVTNRCVIIH